MEWESSIVVSRPQAIAEEAAIKHVEHDRFWIKLSSVDALRRVLLQYVLLNAIAIQPETGYLLFVGQEPTIFPFAASDPSHVGQ